MELRAAYIPEVNYIRKRRAKRRAYKEPKKEKKLVKIKEKNKKLKQ